MKASIILGHPTKGSFNHAIADTVREFFLERGDDIFFHDLYEENFDPCLPSEEVPKNGRLDPVIRKYCEEIAISDCIIVIHPDWWGQPPAILKGWIDRVIRPGVAYGFEEGNGGDGIPIGLLKAQFAVVFNTSNTSSEREQSVFGDPPERLWRDCIFGLCGVKTFHRKMYSVVCTSAPEQRKMWLDDVRDILVRASSKAGTERRI